MTQTWTRIRGSAHDAVAILAELLADCTADDKRLIAAYLEAKQTLAAAFEALVIEKYYDPSVIENVKKALEREMRESYPYLPEKYLKVRGFGDSHAKLLAYLSKHVETEVSTASLRMLTSDAIHTERRTRELRDLGFELVTRRTGGTNIYTLCSASPNLSKGAAAQIIKNISGDKSISSSEKDRLLRLSRQSG